MVDAQGICENGYGLLHSPRAEQRARKLAARPQIARVVRDCFTKAAFYEAALLGVGAGLAWLALWCRAEVSVSGQAVTIASALGVGAASI